jgi:hypothetical protein
MPDRLVKQASRGTGSATIGSPVRNICCVRPAGGSTHVAAVDIAARRHLPIGMADRSPQRSRSRPVRADVSAHRRGQRGAADQLIIQTAEPEATDATPQTKMRDHRSSANRTAARRVARLIHNCEQAVPAFDVLRYAWTAQRGPGDWVAMTWLTQPLLIFRRHRIVAVSHKHIYVFSASSFSNLKPKRLLRVLDPEELLTAPRRNGLMIGGEHLRVSRSYAEQVIGAVKDLR